MRYGLVGTGFWARTTHAPAAPNFGLEVVRVLAAAQAQRGQCPE
jgi:predicted dehydrogenase